MKNQETPDGQPIRCKPVTPKDLIEGGLASKNVVYEAIRTGQIPSFRLGGKIIIEPTWARDHLDW
jgi:hypothetical protein